MLLPRRVLGRNVELGEVVVVGLDVGTFRHGKTHVGEDLDHLVEHLGDRMDAAIADRPEPHRQRDVDPFTLELPGDRCRLQRCLAGLEGGADALLQHVDRLAVALALRGRQRGELLHQLRHAPFLAERGDAHRFELGEVFGGVDPGDELAREVVEVG